MSIFPPIPKEIIDSLHEAENVVVIGHSNPDGDCIASTLSLAYMLRKLGKNVETVNAGPFINTDIRPFESRFLKNASEEMLARKPLIAVVDCSTADRPGAPFKAFEGLKTVVFDHHSAGVPFTEENLMYIVPSSISTTLVLEQVRLALGIELDKELANLLYIGFATDSGFFHFVNERNGGEALRIVSGWIDAGVSPYIVYDQMHDGKSLDYFKITGELIERTMSEYDGRLLYTYMEKELETDGRPGDLIYAQLLQVSGVKLILFFKEKEDSVEIGMRSKNLSGVDAGAFASSLGGGGHRYAAGATVKGSLQEVIPDILSKVKDIPSFL